jgi:hypothetical protein
MTMLVTVCIIYVMKVHVILDAFCCPFLPPCVGEGYDPGWMILEVLVLFGVWRNGDF